MFVFANFGGFMEYITAKAAAEKWGVTPRRVQILCSQKKIKGAYRFGKSWMIPVTAILPSMAKGIFVEKKLEAAEKNSVP